MKLKQPRLNDGAKGTPPHAGTNPMLQVAYLLGDWEVTVLALAAVFPIMNGE